MSEAATHYEPGTHPDLPPPREMVGAWHWMKENLFSSPVNAALTLVTIYAIYMIVPGILNWAIFDATFVADSRRECLDLSDGACWATSTTTWR